MVEKDRSRIVNKTYLMTILPLSYQTHFQSQLNRAEYLLLILLVNLLQSIKQVKLETLATALPFPITFDSRRKKIQRFLSRPQLTIEKIWFPILQAWLKADFDSQQVLHLAIERTNWGCINLLMISLIWDKRAYPVYWELLPKQGNSNFNKQTTAISKVLPLFKDYRIVVLGDREFCSVKLGNWLVEQKVYFCLRLRQNEFVLLEDEIWQQLGALGLSPGISFYLNGVRVTKQKGFARFNVAGKWKRKYWGWAPDEGWFILTNLSDLDSSILAYKKRFGIEEMFRDFKSGGYNERRD